MLQTIMENIDLILTVAAGIVSVASLIAAGTKTPAPDTFLGKVYKVIDFLALNIGKAKDTGKGS